MEFNVENMPINEIKKMFNTSSSISFFNEYTLQDIEETKKILFIKYYQEFPNREKQIQVFLDNCGIKLMKDKMSQSIPMDIKLHNSTKNNIVPVSNKEYERIINIDSLYRETLYPHGVDRSSETDFLMNLNDNLNDTISLKLSSITIPFTFYNIESRQGNNYFYVETPSTSSFTKIDISDGNYTNETVISAINTSLTNSSIDLTCELNTVTGKTKFTNESTSDVSYNVIFYDYLDQDTNFSSSTTYSPTSQNAPKLNNNLGWMLGFRNVNVDTGLEITYSLEQNSSVESEAVSFIGHTKYFIVVLDDLNPNQTNKRLVQIDVPKHFMKVTNYFSENDNSLNCLTDTNFDTFVSDSSRTLTKKQLYSRLQYNNYVVDYSEKNSKIDAKSFNNIFAIIPFDTKSLVWNKSIYFSDKNTYVRKYFGPVDISKMHVKIYDDHGILLNLNGAQWSMNIISSHTTSVSV